MNDVSKTIHFFVAVMASFVSSTHGAFSLFTSGKCKIHKSFVCGNSPSIRKKHFSAHLSPLIMGTHLHAKHPLHYEESNRVYSSPGSNANISSSQTNLTRTLVRKMKVTELRNELVKRGMSTDGLRKDLVTSLLNSLGEIPSRNKQTRTIAMNHEAHSETNLSQNVVYVLRFHGESNYIDVSASFGAVLYDSETSKIVWKGRMYMKGGESAHMAEYIGLKQSLEIVHKLGARKINIQGNSKNVVIKQLQGNYKVRVKEMKPIFEYVHNFIKQEFESCELWEINLDQNRKAHTLARKAMDARSSDEGFDMFDRDNNNQVGSDDVFDHFDCKNEDKVDEIESDMIIHREAEENSNHQKAEINALLGFPALSPNKVYVLQFDGGARGNPGVSGAGMVLFDFDSGLEVWSAYKFLDVSTNNVAEYSGLVTGLQCARAMGVNHIKVEGDSQLVVKQINGEYAVKAENLKPLYHEALSLSTLFQSFELKHIPRALNFRADQLSNVAMDEQRSSSILNDLDSLTADQVQSAGDIWSEIQNPTPPLMSHNGGKRSYDVLTEKRKTGQSQPKAYDEENASMGDMIDLPHPNDTIIPIASQDHTYHLKFSVSSSNKGTRQGAGIGLFSEDEDTIWSGSYYIENISTNIAAYVAVIIGLRWALSLGVREIIVEGTSDLIINQMTGKFRVKSEKLKPYHREAIQLSRNFASFDIVRDQKVKKVTLLSLLSKKAVEDRISNI